MSKADGHASARRCAAMLGIALCAETTSASLQEEGRKVDLKISFRDPYSGVSRNLNCQVKSGNSYRADSSTPSHIKLEGIDQKTLAAFQDDLGLIAWVPPKPSSAIYWFIARRDTRRDQIKIPRHTQRVSPALRFILARESVQREHRPGIAQQTVPPAGAERLILLTARAVYRKLKHVASPIFGNVVVTRTAWRHITRASKLKSRRVRSLRVVPYLAKILAAKPDNHAIKEAKVRIYGARTLEIRTIVCWYRNALLIDGERRSVMLRIREEISYPTSWFKYPLSEGDVVQRATVLSWWVRE